jgi:hypothetical protein
MEKHAVSRSKLLWAMFIIEIMTILSGLFVYAQAPSSYVFVSSEQSTGFFEGSGDLVFQVLRFPTGTVHEKFAMNTTISVSLNCTEIGLDIYLLNTTQFQRFYSGGNPKDDCVFASGHPNYDFSMQVNPDDYVVVVNRTNFISDNSVGILAGIEVTFINFDYSHVWPGLYITLMGIGAANVNIFLMKRAQLFKKVGLLFRSMFVARMTIPKKTAFSKYALRVYEELLSPVASWIVQFVPVLLAVFAVFLAEPSSTSPFANISWDYAARTALTVYFALIFLVSLALIIIMGFTVIPSEISIIISKKLGLLKEADVKNSAQMHTLSLSTLTRRRNWVIFSVPLLLFTVLFATVFRPQLIQELRVPSAMWAGLVIMMGYYGLVFSYIQSASMKEFVSSQFGRTARKRFLSRLRLQSLIEGSVVIVAETFEFAVIIGIIVSFFYYLILPVMYSSLANKYGMILAPSQPPALIGTFIVLLQIVLILIVLVWSIFYLLTGYIVPELLDRGQNWFFVGSIAFIMTFFTDRALSATIAQYLNTDLVLSLLLSFGMFVLVWVFEKFYKRMLQKYEIILRRKKKDG